MYSSWFLSLYSAGMGSNGFDDVGETVLKRFVGRQPGVHVPQQVTFQFLPVLDTGVAQIMGLFRFFRG